MRRVFGKKKEEDWEYVEQYFQKDNYGQVADKEYWHKEHSSTDYLEELFRPHLKRDEQILCVIGSGQGDLGNPLESPKAMKLKYKSYKAKIAILVLFIIGIILCTIFARPDIIGGFVTTFFSVLICSFPLLILALIIVGITLGSKGNKEANYAITDQRLLKVQYKELKQLSLKTVTDTFVQMNSDNTGKLIIKACRDLGSPTNYTYTIPKVNDPYRVKAILDEAVQKHKIKLYNN